MKNILKLNSCRVAEEINFVEFRLKIFPKTGIIVWLSLAITGKQETNNDFWNRLFIRPRRRHHSVLLLKILVIKVFKYQEFSVTYKYMVFIYDKLI